MKKYFEGKYSLAINFWGFLIFGGLIVRGACGYFSAYLNAPDLLLLAIIYTFITSVVTWRSASNNKESHPSKYIWKGNAAQIISLLHLIGGIYIFFDMYLNII